MYSYMSAAGDHGPRLTRRRVLCRLLPLLRRKCKENTQCGYLITVTAKPGFSPFRDNCLKTDASDLPEVTMPVKGLLHEIIVFGSDGLTPRRP